MMEQDGKIPSLVTLGQLPCYNETSFSILVFIARFIIYILFRTKPEAAHYGLEQLEPLQDQHQRTAD